MVLLRGEIFRWEDVPEKGSCSSNTGATKQQWIATDSLKNYVVSPLEEQGCTVEVVASVAFRSGLSPCNRFEEYLDRLGRSRIIQSNMFATRSQSESLKGAFDTLQKATNIAQYDIVYVARHDIIYNNNAGWRDWKGDLSNFNYQTWKCYESVTDLLVRYGVEARFDLVWEMPGHVVDTFAATIGSTGSECFEAQTRIHNVCIDSGHCCDAGIKKAMPSIGVGVGKLSDQFRMVLTELGSDDRKSAKAKQIEGFRALPTSIK